MAGGTTLGRDITNAISLIMPLVRNRNEQHSLAHLYYSSSPTLDAVAAVAAPIPSSKLHNTVINTLRIRFRIRLRLPQLLIIHYSLLISIAMTASIRVWVSRPIKTPSRQSCEIAA